MRGAWLIAALAASGCWDFESLSNGGDAGALGDGRMAAADANPNLDFAVADLTTLPDLHRRSLSFGAPLVLGTDTSPSGLAIADFNNDGFPDFAVLSPTIHTYAAWLNQHTKTFSKRGGGNVTGGFNTWIGAGTIFGGPNVDLVIPNATSLQGDGQGNFTPLTWAMPTASTPSAIADLDKDGHLDLYVGDGSGIHMLKGDGQGHFTAGDAFIGAGTTFDLAAADFNSDGFIDAVQADGDMVTGGVRVLYNDNGNAGATTSFNNVHNITAVTIGDIDGDGDPDVVATAGAAAEGLIFTNDKGTLTQSPDTFAVGAGPRSAALGDLDGDGLLDLVVSAHDAGKIDVLLNDGTGKFTGQLLFDPGNAPGKVLLADFDRDGLLDILVALPDNAGVAVIFNSSM